MDISSNHLFQNIKYGDDRMDKEMKNNIKIIALLLVVFIVLYALHITIGDRFESQFEESVCFIDGPNIVFSEDQNNKTLTVTEIYPQDKDWYWSEIFIVNGSATLPYGLIKAGDRITNCEGYLELK